ncbi:MAG: Ldh family oxidoreductase [Geminicoccaceae bacterium]
MTEQTETRRVTVERLCGFIERALTALGMPGEDARTVASLMAEADALGSDGHGIFRLPQYVKRIRAGGINLHPRIRIERERAGMALLDGDNAMGHLVMRRAAELAVAKAADAGVAWVGAHHSNHAGPASLYARIPLARDMIGLYVAVGNANHLPPWGGTELLLSTNPIAIAVPAATRPPIVLDMATTVAAYGKVKTRAQRGEAMPEGWMIDREGRPLTDPKRADEGFLLPIGGYKGYGLGLMFGILAGILNGAACGRDTIDFNADFTTPTNTGQFVVAIDVGAFLDLAAFKRQIDTVWDTMKSSALLPGFDEIRLPGERTHGVEQERRARGVPLHPALDRTLAGLAAELDVEPL